MSEWEVPKADMDLVLEAIGRCIRADYRAKLIEAVEIPEIKELLSAAGSLLGCATRDCDDFGDEFWVVGDDDYEALDKAFDTIQGIVTGGV